MKLLFDHNLSFKLCRPLTVLFPGTTQVRLVGLADATDRAVWDYAKANGFTLVSLDSDFGKMAALLGPPPKVIWLQPADHRHRESTSQPRRRDCSVRAGRGRCVSGDLLSRIVGPHRPRVQRHMER